MLALFSGSGTSSATGGSGFTSSSSTGGEGSFGFLTLADFLVSGLGASLVVSSAGTFSAGDFLDLDSIMRLTASEDLSCFCSIARWSKFGSGLRGLREARFFLAIGSLGLTSTVAAFLGSPTFSSAGISGSGDSTT